MGTTSKKGIGMSDIKEIGTSKRSRTRFIQRFIQWVGEHPWRFAVALFILSVAVRFCCGALNGPMVLTVYPDERRYFQIAKSIADGGPFMVLGDPTDFQKILYPLIISPAFLFSSDPLIQIRIIGIINCLIMSSVVFPVTLLTRKLTSKAAVLALVLTATVTLPDLVNTAMFMSEVLYLPLSIWLLYFFSRAMSEEKRFKRQILFALFGFVSYLLYLTKEIGAACLIAAALLLIIDGIRNRPRLARNMIDLLVCVFVFFAVFIAVKQFLFVGLGNSYDRFDQTSLSVLSSLNVWFYLFYSAASLLVAAVMSYYILPVILPVFGYSAMNEDNRRMYLYSLISLVIMIGAIAYTISIREDLGDLVPRLHLRYIAPLVIPFWIQCFDFLLTKNDVKQDNICHKSPKNREKKRRDSQKDQKFMRRFLILGIGVCFALIVMLPSGPTNDAFVIHYSFGYTFLMKLLTFSGADSIYVNMIWWICKMILLALTLIGLFLLLKSKKRTLFFMLVCTIFAVSALDNFIDYQALKYYNSVELLHEDADTQDFSTYMAILFAPDRLQKAQDLVDAVCSSSSYIMSLDNAMIFLPEQYLRYFETYGWPDDILTHALLLQPGSWLKKAKEAGGLLALDNDNKNEYIITTEKYNSFMNVEVIYRKSPLIILHNLNPATLYINAAMTPASAGGG